jgi:MORN repeat
MPKSKTKTNSKRYKRIGSRRRFRGAGFADRLRRKTKRIESKHIGRTYIDSEELNMKHQQEKNIYKPKTTTNNNDNDWADNGQMFDSNFGPGAIDFYQGPSIKKNDYVSRAIPHGSNGSIAYATGDSFTGDFVKGKRQGKGTLTIKNGPTYSGQWTNDSFIPLVNWKKTLKSKK